jgi:hypothetical protein
MLADLMILYLVLTMLFSTSLLIPGRGVLLNFCRVALGLMLTVASALVLLLPLK